MIKTVQADNVSGLVRTLNKLGVTKEQLITIIPQSEQYIAMYYE